MSAKYDPKKIIQLLQVSAWKCKTTLDYSGFSPLEKVILQSSFELKTKDNDIPDIKQKYLNDLLDQSKSALLEGKTIGKNKSYITPILHYNNLSDWSDYESIISRVDYYFKEGAIDLSQFEKNEISILIDDEENKLDGQLTFINDHNKIPVSRHFLKASDEQTLSEQINVLLLESPVIIWCISDNWNNLTTSNSTLKQLLDSGRIIPIRIGQELNLTELKASVVDNKIIASGELGLSLGIARITEMLNALAEANHDAQHTKTSGNKTLNIDTNKGNVNQINNQEIKGGNVVFGGSFNQHFYKGKK